MCGQSQVAGHPNSSDEDAAKADEHPAKADKHPAKADKHPNSSDEDATRVASQPLSSDAHPLPSDEDAKSSDAYPLSPDVPQICRAALILLLGVAFFGASGVFLTKRRKRRAGAIVRNELRLVS